MPDSLHYQLANAEATEALGARLAKHSRAPLIIFLQGNLGAGKTTLVRGFLKACGHTGAVRSPTYTLAESYPLPRGRFHHFDLYRLGDPEELEYIGIRDYLDGEAVALFEWPEQGEGVLPPPDLVVSILYQAAGRSVEVSAATSRGEHLLTLFASEPEGTDLIATSSAN